MGRKYIRNIFLSAPNCHPMNIKVPNTMQMDDFRFKIDFFNEKFIFLFIFVFYEINVDFVAGTRE